MKRIDLIMRWLAVVIISLTVVVVVLGVGGALIASTPPPTLWVIAGIVCAELVLGHVVFSRWLVRSS